MTSNTQHRMDGPSNADKFSEKWMRSVGKTPPSHANFDRSKFSDEEFITLLQHENRELRSTISSQTDRIQQIEQLLSLHNIVLPAKPRYSTSSETFFPLEDDVPQRSARRRRGLDAKTENEEATDRDQSKDIKRDSVASITSNGPIDMLEGIPLSSDFRSELSAGAALAESPRKAGILSMTSKSQERNSTNNLDTGNEVSSTTEGPALARLNELELDNSSFASAPPRGGLNSSGGDVDQQRRRSSTSTVSSYKSRIKLPVTMKSAETMNSKSGPNIGITTDFTEGKEFNASTPVSVSHGIENGIRDSTSDLKEKLSIPQLPQTPDAFSDSFGKQLSKPHLTEPVTDERRNLFDSPFLSSPAQSSLTSKNYSNTDVLSTPVRQGFNSTDSFSSLQRPSSQTPGSSFHILHTPKYEEEEVLLFIKPEEFQTVRIKVVSTITKNPKRLDDPNCTFSINDKDTGKEMWRIRKSFSQMVAFDAEIRPVIEFFGLPHIPEKASLSSTTPMKVENRKNSLQDYFNTIFMMPHIPQIVLYRICRYISLDIINPLDDFKSGAKKEGYLIRRYKGLGTTWKVRWCQVDGPALEIYDNPGGLLLEQIRLSGSQIGRQSSDAVAEERGYRHAFLILEAKSSKISGSYPKHFFCAESDEERDEWVAAMVEFTENDPLSQNEPRGLEFRGAELTPTRGMSSQDDVDTNGRSFNTFNGGLHYEEDPKNQVEDSAQQLKEAKKMKKRSLFPFRSRATNQSEEIAPNLAVSVDSSEPQGLWPQGQGEHMQVYLDQLNLSDEPTRLIFGREIKDAFALSNHQYNARRVPSIIYRCLDFLTKNGAVYEEGIFRLSGSASSIRQLKEKFNSAFDIDLFESPLKPDIHTVAGLLKTYLRELPNPIFGQQAYNKLQNMVAGDDSAQLLSKTSLKVRDYLQDPRNIDAIHYDFCVTIIGYLRAVIAQSSINRMSLKNICIVFVPTLNVSVEVLSLCLVDYECIFGNASPVPDRNREKLDLQIPIF